MATASDAARISADPTQDSQKRPREQFFWLWIVCLLGLDYFSTLAYQPSITYQVAGRLGPIATAVVVLATLFGALPVYWYLAARSPSGQGTLGILDRMVHGWRGKTLVLILLGFAATDFTMLKAISLADASVHLVVPRDGQRQDVLRHVAHDLRERAALYFGPEVEPYFTEQLVVTLVLGLLGFLFWFLLRRGFNRNVVLVSVPLIAAYLVLNGMLIAAGLERLLDQPQLVTAWLERVADGDWGVPAAHWTHDGWGHAALVSLIFLPNLALGLSGFELNMILMPQVRGSSSDTEGAPRGRIANTRKVLLVAALIMAFYLLATVTLTTLLIPHDALVEGGEAANRAMAYLAHGGALTTGDQPLLPICGPEFGLVYDLVTVLVLCLAGTSVMTALASLIPHFLSRFGMEFRWVRRWGVLMLLFAAINAGVTVFFHANVSDQRGAYATGVLVLLASASVLAVSDIKGRHDQAPPRGLASWLLAQLQLGFFSLIALVFITTMVAVLLRSGSGVAIALCFIALIFGMSVSSRALRANEMRTVGFEFADDRSKFLWESLVAADFPILVPHRPGRQSAADKEAVIRQEHSLDESADLVIVEVTVDDPSNFYQRLHIEISAEGRRYVIRVTRCCSIAHAIAAIALEMSRCSKPPGVHFGWSNVDILSASWNYLAFGEGNIPWKVRELIHQMEPDPTRRPRVIVG